MIRIEAKILKYGVFNSIEILEFKNEEDVYKYINDKKFFSFECEEEEKEAGENIYSFKEVFSFNGQNYRFYVDA